MADVTAHHMPNMEEVLVLKTGLEPETVRELLAKGWRYVEGYNQVSRWDHPEWSLTDKNAYRA